MSYDRSRPTSAMASPSAITATIHHRRRSHSRPAASPRAMESVIPPTATSPTIKTPTMKVSTR